MIRLKALTCFVCSLFALFVVCAGTSQAAKISGTVTTTLTITEDSQLVIVREAGSLHRHLYIEVSGRPPSPCWLGPLRTRQLYFPRLRGLGAGGGSRNASPELSLVPNEGRRSYA